MGRREGRPPPDKNLSISRSFCKNLAKSYVGVLPTPGGLAPLIRVIPDPPLEKVTVFIFSVSEAISWNLDYHVLNVARHQCGLVSNLFTRTKCRTVNRAVCDGVSRVHCRDEEDRSACMSGHGC